MENFNNFTVYGINHNFLTLLEREEFVKLFRPHKKLKELLEENLADDGLLLATCLRNEFYFWKETPELKNHFLGIKGSFVKKGSDALEHLFKVVCGFDSAIPGEEQILAQIKKAYIEKIEKGERPSPLNSIFNKAIALGKKFRFESKINENSVSVEALGIKESEKIFSDISTTNIFIVGAGEIASSLFKILRKKGCKNISVIKRRKSMIEENIDYFTFDNKIELFYKSDIIFSTTSAPHLIFELHEFSKEKLENKNRVIIDFAVPRDVDEKIGELKNQTLVNLDGLNSSANTSYEKRLQICQEYQWLLTLGMEKTLEWFSRRKI